ncbi:MAG: DUF2384 domain-containing protein [Chromatiales bacterium]|nr:DUF2384 domain-containing protein [Chromatiales bacterium]
MSSLRADIYQAALQLFDGDQVAAERWLRTPAKALGGRAPLELLEFKDGTKVVRDLIGRLEHGVIT